MPEGGMMPSECSNHTCQYAVTLLFPVAGSLPTPVVTCGRRLSSAVGNLSLQLALFKVRDEEFGVLGFL